jgi:hypothetical protein
MILRFACRLDKLCHHMGRRWQIGVTHTEVDNVFAPVTGLHLHAIDDAKHVRRQPLDALKFHSALPRFW